jgi:hypothetical protein
MATQEKGFVASLKKEEPPIDYLRRMVKCFDHNNESMNQRFSIPELLNIWSAWTQCEYDYYPDQWSEEQLLAAANDGTIPEFED